MILETIFLSFYLLFGIGLIVYYLVYNRFPFAIVDLKDLILLSIFSIFYLTIAVVFSILFFILLAVIIFIMPILYVFFLLYVVIFNK